MTTNRMISRCVALVVCLTCAASVAPVLAQPSAPVTAAVDTILAQFPTAGPAARDAMAAHALALGEPGLADLTRRLVAQGAGNDVAARWAVNAVAVYASEASNPERRALAERGLIAALASAADVEVRTFLIGQLRLVGRDAAVKAVTPLLADAALVEPATQLLLAVKGAPARTALMKALPAAAPASRVTIVKALGELGATESNAAVLALIADTDPGLRRVVLSTLAKLASPTSYVTITGAAKAAGFKYEPTNAVGAIMDYASHLAARGQTETAVRVCRFVMANATAPDVLSLRSAALATLVRLRGAAGVADLLTAVDHADLAYRAAALRLATTLPGPFPAAAWVTKARAVDAPRRAEIITMLGQQGGRQAVPYVRTALADTDADVVIAAAEALAHVEGNRATADLVPLLKSSTGDVAARAAGVLMWTADEKNLDPLVALLDTLAPPAKAAAIGVVGARGGRRFASRVFALANDGDSTVRTAALTALAGVAGPSDLPALFTLLDKAEGDTVAPVQRAVVAAAAQIVPESGRAAPLVQAMRTASLPERLIDVLPQVGGAPALAAVVAEFDGANAERKAAAFRALSRWPGTDASDKLFAIFVAGDPAYRNTAFSSYVRQIGSSSLAPAQKLASLKKALDKSTTVGDRRILLRAFERIKTAESFALVAPLLDHADIGSEAAAAAMRIALPTGPGSDDGLTGTAVRAGLTKALGLVKGQQAESDKESIRNYLATIR